VLRWDAQGRRNIACAGVGFSIGREAGHQKNFPYLRNRKVLMKKVLWSRRAFTIVELLSVVGIIAVLLALIVPTVAGLKGSGRKGGINLVIGTLEQARTAAVESGRTTHVVFVKNESDSDMLAIFREPVGKDGLPSDDTKYDQLTPWRKLPQGFVFKGEDGDENIFHSSNGEFHVDNLPVQATRIAFSELAVMSFNANGSVLSPQGSANHNKILIAEDSRNQQPVRDVISVSQYTGRCQHNTVK